MDKFWELIMILSDSHVDEKHYGFYKTEIGVETAEKEFETTPGLYNNGSLYRVEHKFDD